MLIVLEQNLLVVQLVRLVVGEGVLLAIAGRRLHHAADAGRAHLRNGGDELEEVPFSALDHAFVLAGPLL